jgi:hypothetical protein
MCLDRSRCRARACACGAGASGTRTSRETNETSETVRRGSHLTTLPAVGPPSDLKQATGLKVVGSRLTAKLTANLQNEKLWGQNGLLLTAGFLLCLLRVRCKNGDSPSPCVGRFNRPFYNARNPLTANLLQRLCEQVLGVGQPSPVAHPGRYWRPVDPRRAHSQPRDGRGWGYLWYRSGIKVGVSAHVPGRVPYTAWQCVPECVPYEPRGCPCSGVIRCGACVSRFL